MQLRAKEAEAKMQLKEKDEEAKKRIEVEEVKGQKKLELKEVAHSKRIIELIEQSQKEKIKVRSTMMKIHSTELRKVLRRMSQDHKENKKKVLD